MLGKQKDKTQQKQANKASLRKEEDKHEEDIRIKMTH
jgi:hypothetical protein